MQRHALHRLLFVFSFSFCSFIVPAQTAHCRMHRFHWHTNSEKYNVVDREPLSLSKVKASLNHTMRLLQHAIGIYSVDFDFDYTHFCTLSLSVFVCACVYLHGLI